MYNPVSTYRIQFNKEFTFTHLDALIPYLQKLGIQTIYASPIFAAVPESVHGYDGVNPNRINPEIGTEEQLRTISQRLQQAGMGWVQDIVPNHMAYHINNEWLTDMLEKGNLSRYASFFDTSLASSFFHGRIVAPVLPEPLDEALAKGDLTLVFEEGRFMIKTGENLFPVKAGSYATVLQATTDVLNDAIRQLLDQLDQVHRLDEPEAYALAWDEFRNQLLALTKNAVISEYVQNCIKAVNTDLTRLQQLASEQHYRFCDEPETRQAINYRRFFAVNSLICLNINDETVFQHVHSLTKSLVNDGVFQGLRVDHIDGLFDPERYVDRLRKLVGDDTYIVVEKILQADEDLPASWPVEGTTGYDFLAMVNNLLTDGRSEQLFRDFYTKLIDSDTSLPDRIRGRKAYFLAQFMGGEQANLHQYFLDLNLAEDDQLTELSVGELKVAIGELLVECPVYRYYGNQFPLPDNEAKIIRKLLETIRKANPNLATAVDVLEDALIRKPPVADEAYNSRALRFYQRLMQFSGPLMAKGVEDTLLYTYNCFIGHNEVGDSPERFGLSVDAFHKVMQTRQQHWPLAQNTTATHDTKRGEDARARLNVLTDLADEWLTEVQHWQQLNGTLKRNDTPDPNDEYFIYQNLIGTYPMSGESKQDEDDFDPRFQQYLEKALQEAKRHTTGWTVDDSYHKDVQVFTAQLLDKKGPFWKRFQTFHRAVADFGVVNSLVQVLLKFTCPGVPDVYQGGEGWDFSLVDPDNRRPVDFAKRTEWLANEANWADLWQHRFDGRIKGWLTQVLLRERQQNQALFAEGQYIPLTVEGEFRDYVMAFARQHDSMCYVVIVPLHTAQLCRQQNKNVLALDWQDTRVVLPASAPTSWTSLLLGTSGDNTSSLPVQKFLTHLPLDLLRLG